LDLSLLTFILSPTTLGCQRGRHARVSGQAVGGVVALQLGVAETWATLTLIPDNQQQHMSIQGMVVVDMVLPRLFVEVEDTLGLLARQITAAREGTLAALLATHGKA